MSTTLTMAQFSTSHSVIYAMLVLDILLIIFILAFSPPSMRGYKIWIACVIFWPTVTIHIYGSTFDWVATDDAYILAWHWRVPGFICYQMLFITYYACPLTFICGFLYRFQAMYVGATKSAFYVIFESAAKRIPVFILFPLVIIFTAIMSLPITCLLSLVMEFDVQVDPDVLLQAQNLTGYPPSQMTALRWRKLSMSPIFAVIAFAMSMVVLIVPLTTITWLCYRRLGQLKERSTSERVFRQHRAFCYVLFGELAIEAGLMIISTIGLVFLVASPPAFIVFIPYCLGVVSTQPIYEIYILFKFLTPYRLVVQRCASRLMPKRLKRVDVEKSTTAIVDTQIMSAVIR